MALLIPEQADRVMGDMKRALDRADRNTSANAKSTKWNHAWFTKETDAAANSTATRYFWRPTQAARVGSVYFTPDANMAADATNFGRLSVAYFDRNANKHTKVATLTVDKQPLVLGLPRIFEIHTPLIPVGAAVYVAVLKGGTGTAVPSGTIQVDWEGTSG